jgi:hypothetical protein
MEPITTTAWYSLLFVFYGPDGHEKSTPCLLERTLTMNVVRSENVVVKLFFERKIMFVFTWSEVIAVSRAQASSCTTCRR